MNGQMWHLEAGILSKDDSQLDYVFNNLNKLLIQKYGPITRDESKQNTTKYIWMLNGDTKIITLAKMGTFFFGEEKFSGTVYVTYKNIQLYEALKKRTSDNHGYSSAGLMYMFPQTFHVECVARVASFLSPFSQK